MEPEGPLPHPQVPATCLYPQTDQSNPCLPSNFLKIHFNNIFPLTLGLPNGVCSSSLLSPICATYPAHLIILDLIIRIIFGEEYRSFNSSLCSLVHSLFTSSLIGPNIFLSTPILEYPQPTFLPQCDGSSLTSIHKNGPNYSCVYLYLYIFG